MARPLVNALDAALVRRACLGKLHREPVADLPRACRFGCRRYVHERSPRLGPPAPGMAASPWKQACQRSATAASADRRRLVVQARLRMDSLPADEGLRSGPTSSLGPERTASPRSAGEKNSTAAMAATARTTQKATICRLAKRRLIGSSDRDQASNALDPTRWKATLEILSSRHEPPAHTPDIPATKRPGPRMAGRYRR